MEDYIGQEAKAQSHQCAKISIEVLLPFFALYSSGSISKIINK